MNDPLLDNLNSPQRQAVLATQGPVLVLAGAGSGKTRVLTHRVAHILREGLAGGAAGGTILAVTFTNKAAREMRERIERLIGDDVDAAGLQVGTFHAICARLLRRAAPVLGYPSSFTIYDADDALALLTPLVARYGASGLPPRAARARISGAKNALVSPAALAARARGVEEERLAEIYRAYQDALARAGAWDFDDLLRCAVEALETDATLLARERARFRYVLVDEYQDTNHAQYRFVQLLAGVHRNLCVVGDDDQSIYGFRGADLRNILEFEKDFPETLTIRLEQNYRSTRTILAAAHGVVSRNAGRKLKELWTENPQGDPVEVVLAADDREEAREIAARIASLSDSGEPFGDVAVLYRTNAQSRAIEDALRRARVPHRLVGGIRFYERREVKDALAWLRALDNPRDDLSFKRLLGAPRRGIGAATSAALEERAEREGAPLQAAAASLVAEREAGAGAARPGGVAAALREIGRILERFRERAAREPVSAFLQDLLEESGLLAFHRDSGEPEAAERADNLRELVASAAEFSAGALEPDLGGFLQDVALLSEVDSAEFGGSAATLLTLHNAKGLEFPIVFIAGVEEGLLPFTRGEAPADVEEERRLFYVGLTRARRRVVLSAARRRARYGWAEDSGGLSRFLGEIPQDLLRVNERHGWRSAASASSLAGPAARGAARVRGRGAGGWLAGEGADGLPWRPDGGDGFVPDEQPDYEAGDDLAPRYARGERVRHARFGGGTIVRLSGAGSDFKVVVDFDGEGEKTLVARLARLEREV
jgi:DNA helicase-2/ATP-dependent DNA helicase PcrA